VWLAAGILLGIAAALALVRGVRPLPAPPSVVQLSINLPEGHTLSSGRTFNFDITPDGTQIVYSANYRLYRRSLSDFDVKPIPGSESRSSSNNPVFSPDGRSVAFYAAGEDAIKRIGIDGGTSVTLCSACGGGASMFWTRESILTYSSRGIFRVPVDGGTPEIVIKLGDDESAQVAQMLPDGDNILFSLAQGDADDRWNKATILVQSMKTGERKTLI
jgi:Tol biopolymer transport system component